MYYKKSRDIVPTYKIMTVLIYSEEVKKMICANPILTSHQLSD